MSVDYLIKLTLLLHQASEWWPESNLLKLKLKSLGNDILKDFILLEHSNPAAEIRSRLFENLERFQDYLSQARGQQLIDRKEFSLLQKEYEQLRIKIQPSLAKDFSLKIKDSSPKIELSAKIKKSKEESRPMNILPSSFSLNERQVKILEVLKEKGRFQVGQIQEFFPQTSKRTIRRDLEDLLKQKQVKRGGEWNRIFYTTVLRPSPPTS